MTARAYYSDSITDFLGRSSNEVLGALTAKSSFTVEATQRDAWAEQTRLLHTKLAPYVQRGKVYFEYAIPRLGKRIDVVLLIEHVLFVLEFKVGEDAFPSYAIDQVWDYAIDLKNFHETTHDKAVVPVLIATRATEQPLMLQTTLQDDGILRPMCIAPGQIGDVIDLALRFCDGPGISPAQWETGGYHPTPTIIEAAMALYGGHAVTDISRSDAAAINLSQTSDAISSIIESSQINRHKVLCLVTGIPGAGKTLVGLNIANQHTDKDSAL